jgi:hypothetical protein
MRSFIASFWAGVRISEMQLLQSVPVIAAATAAMHHNHINLSHSLLIKPDNPLLNPGDGMP